MCSYGFQQPFNHLLVLFSLSSSFRYLAKLCYLSVLTFLPISCTVWSSRFWLHGISELRGTHLIICYFCINYLLLCHNVHKITIGRTIRIYYLTLSWLKSNKAAVWSWLGLWFHLMLDWGQIYSQAHSCCWQNSFPWGILSGCCLEKATFSLQRLCAVLCYLGFFSMAICFLQVSKGKRF